VEFEARHTVSVPQRHASKWCDIWICEPLTLLADTWRVSSGVRVCHCIRPVLCVIYGSRCTAASMAVWVGQGFLWEDQAVGMVLCFCGYQCILQQACGIFNGPAVLCVPVARLTLAAVTTAAAFAKPQRVPTAGRAGRAHTCCMLNQRLGAVHHLCMGPRQSLGDQHRCSYSTKAWADKQSWHRLCLLGPHTAAYEVSVCNGRKVSQLLTCWPVQHMDRSILVSRGSTRRKTFCISVSSMWCGSKQHVVWNWSGPVRY
jgi:hypothetical protein